MCMFKVNVFAFLYLDKDPKTVVVVTVVSGFVVVILCIFIVFLVRGYHVHRRNKIQKLKSEKEDEYSLLSENIDYVSFQ